MAPRNSIIRYPRTYVQGLRTHASGRKTRKYIGLKSLTPPGLQPRVGNKPLKIYQGTAVGCRLLVPKTEPKSFRTAVPFWGQSSQISSSLPPKRGCGSKGVTLIITWCTKLYLDRSKYLVRTWYSVITSAVSHMQDQTDGKCCRRQCQVIEGNVHCVPGTNQVCAFFISFTKPMPRNRPHTGKSW